MVHVHQIRCSNILNPLHNSLCETSLSPRCKYDNKYKHKILLLQPKTLTLLQGSGQHLLQFRPTPITVQTDLIETGMRNGKSDLRITENGNFECEIRDPGGRDAIGSSDKGKELSLHSRVHSGEEAPKPEHVRRVS